MESTQIDRDVIVGFHAKHNQQELAKAVARGEWTADEARQAHEAFLASDVLETLVNKDLAVLEKLLTNRLH